MPRRRTSWARRPRRRMGRSTGAAAPGIASPRSPSGRRRPGAARQVVIGLPDRPSSSQSRVGT
eukprot:12379962-Alexandrium_andersonii.AAC.1